MTASRHRFSAALRSRLKSSCVILTFTCTVLFISLVSDIQRGRATILKVSIVLLALDTHGERRYRYGPMQFPLPPPVETTSVNGADVRLLHRVSLAAGGRASCT